MQSLRELARRVEKRAQFRHRNWCPALAVLEFVVEPCSSFATRQSWFLTHALVSLATPFQFVEVGDRLTLAARSKSSPGRSSLRRFTDSAEIVLSPKHASNSLRTMWVDFAQKSCVRFTKQNVAGRHRSLERSAIDLRRTRAPSPPANAISASATAKPPSLRSWQTRTKPAWIAACRAANSASREFSVDSRHVVPPPGPLTSAKCEPPSSLRVTPTM